MKAKTIGAGAVLLLPLLGCESEADRVFEAACVDRLGHPPATCRCLSQEINAHLSGQGRAYFIALFLENKAAAAKIEPKLGLIERARIIGQSVQLTNSVRKKCLVGRKFSHGAP